MDWSLFWTAFGAIGTTMGSVVTAIAVVVAVKQYKEPLIKRLKIKFTFAIPVGTDFDNDLLCIGVANAGIRSIMLSNIYLNIGEKNLVLNHAQFAVPGFLSPITFPVEIQPEHEVEMYLDRLKMSGFLADNMASGQFHATTPVKILVTDKTGGEHYHSTGQTVKDFASFAMKHK